MKGPDEQQPRPDGQVAPVGPLTPAGRETWEAINELAQAVGVEQWAILGGQMVGIRAAMAGVEPPRVTEDGDVVVDVRAHGRAAMRQIAGTLTGIGFRTSMSPDGVTRFQRDRAKIDLLAPEGIGADVETVPPGHAVQAPGATQALERTEIVTVEWDTGSVTVRCPSLLGALVAKAAASREIVSITADERLKHQQDVVFLLSLVARGSLRGVAAAMGNKDRQRLRAATKPLLADPGHRAWRAATNPQEAMLACQRLLT